MKININIARRAAALCAALAISAGTAAAQEQESRTIVTVKQLIDSPADYAGKTIVAVGMFMGGDGACVGRIDARDWMLQGEGRDCVWVRVEPPQGCDPATKVGVGRRVAAEGIVSMVRNRPMLFPARDPAKSAAQRQQSAQQPRKDPKEAQKERKEATEQRMLEIERERDASQSFSPGELLQNPALFSGMEFFAAGNYRADAAGCGSDAPALEGEWAIEDLLGNCVRARGPVPERAGSASAPADGELVSFKAVMKIETASGSASHYLQAAPRLEEFKTTAPEMRPAAKPSSPK